jgi:glycerophosphoryl diester phosphodiesterase
MPVETGRRPAVVAHRGGCALGPENTLAAFELGLRAGADGLELDVHLSADGVVVVCHDATLDRTTNASGPVAARTADELARVDAGYRFVTKEGALPFRGQGVGVPTLRQVLRRFRDTPVIVEMKVNHAEMGRRLAADVAAEGATERVCAAGDGALSLRAARASLPEMASSACREEVQWALYKSWVGLSPGAPAFRRFQVPEHAGRIRLVSRRFVRWAHRAGLTVDVWTIDDAGDMERFLTWGVDALISNRPDLAVRVRDRYEATRSANGLLVVP